MDRIEHAKRLSNLIVNFSDNSKERHENIYLKC